MCSSWQGLKKAYVVSVHGLENLESESKSQYYNMGIWSIFKADMILVPYDGLDFISVFENDVWNETQAINLHKRCETLCEC